MTINKNGQQRKSRKMNPLGVFLSEGKAKQTHYTEKAQKEVASIVAFYQRKVTLKYILGVEDSKTDSPKVVKLTKITLI